VASPLKVGVISDTHGRAHPKAIDALRGVDVIVHAGDVGGAHVLQELGELAPVLAVRGNVDTEPWATALPWRRRLDLGGATVLLIHDRAMVGPSPAADGIAMVVFGHSHQPLAEQEGGVLWFNPGSAGPTQFGLPVSLGLLEIEDGRFRHRHLFIDPPTTSGTPR
jgi:putative phosphoesterase